MTGERKTLYVDTRWQGEHGIGRYAREVVSRFSTDWSPLSVVGAPSSPREALRRHPQEARGQIVYSPGYNVTPRSSARQIVTVHDLIHLEVGGSKGALYRAYYDLIVKPVIRRAGSVITVSETSAVRIRQWLRDDSVEVLNAGIGVSSAFAVDGPAHEGPRPYLMYVGNLRQHKNTDIIFRSIRGLDVDVRMLLPRSDHDGALALARQHGVEDRIHILHGIDDDSLSALYRGAVATFMPSTLEGFGLPALESVSVRTPVVYWAGCASVAEIVGDRGIAVGSPSSDAEWAAAVRELVHARLRVQPPAASMYDWDRTAMTIQDHLDACRSRKAAK